MKIALTVAGVLVSIPVLLTLWGLAMPSGHVATRAARVAAPPDEVFRLLADVGAQPSWRKDLKSVEILPPRNGRTVWRETGGSGILTLELVESAAPRRLVTRIADDTLPFGGSWTILLAPDGAGTRVTITEDGFVKLAPLRPLARFVFGHTTTIDGYLRHLGAHWGEVVTPSGA